MMFPPANFTARHLAANCYPASWWYWLSLHWYKILLMVTCCHCSTSSAVSSTQVCGLTSEKISLCMFSSALLGSYLWAAMLTCNLYSYSLTLSSLFLSPCLIYLLLYISAFHDPTFTRLSHHCHLTIAIFLHTRAKWCVLLIQPFATCLHPKRHTLHYLPTKMCDLSASFLLIIPSSPTTTPSAGLLSPKKLCVLSESLHYMETWAHPLWIQTFLKEE